MRTKNFLNLLISCFISLLMFVSVFCLFINKFIVPTESKALSTSEITDSITNLKNTRYPDGWSWHNEYSEAEATKIFNGSQCVGFARNLGNIIFGSFPDEGVLNFSTGQTLNGWTAIRGNDVTYVQPGDIIHVAGHAAMVYYLNGETIYVAEAWGSQNSIIKYGLFNGNYKGKGSTLAKLKSNYDFQGVWRYNGTATPNPNLTSNITISGQTIPPNMLKKGSFFGIYGNIKSNLPITLVWGGVYKNDWTVTSQYAEAKPNATSYSLYPYFDNKIVFNGLEEGAYHYLIKARDTSGTEYELINSEFIIGNPNEDPVKISVSSNSINLNMSDRKSATITVSYSGGNNIPNGGMRMYNTTNAQKYVSWKTSASGKTTSVTFTALKEGTVDIVFGFANRDTDEIIAEERITINISGNLEFKSSATSINLNKSKSEKKQITFGYKNYDGKTTISYEHGENRITDCEWGEWSNNSIPLTIKGYANGTEIIKIKLKDTDTGNVLKTINVTVTVTSDPLEFTASSTSISLNKSKSEKKQITFGYKNYDGKVTISYEHGENRITDCEWGEWSNNSIPLTIKGYTNGTEIIKIKLKDTDTGNVLKTINVTVTVTSDPLEFTSSADSVTINGFESKKITFGYKNYDGNVTISFKHGDNEATSLSWDGWKDNKDTLNIKGYAQGEEIITVYLKDSDTGNILASINIKVIVKGIETELIASEDSLNINMDNNEQKSITFSYKNLPAKTYGCSINYEHGEHRATELEWGEWDNHKITLHIKGYRTGTEKITIKLYDKDTDKLLEDKVIVVKVTGTPRIISSDNNISLNYNTKESKILEFNMVNYPYDCSIFYVHGKNPITDCKWNGWNGDTDTLTITPTAPGTEVITVELRLSGEVIASTKVNVTVTAEFVVRFDANGGEVNTLKKTVTFDEIYRSLPVPVRKGYIFDGWYTDKNGGTEIISVTKVSITDSQTLFAHWIEDIIKGDCNNDGVFDISDVVILQKWLLADSSVTLKNWKNADLCEDNRLDVFDLVMMKKQLIRK